MAIEARLYSSENVGFALEGPHSQDFFTDNACGISNLCVFPQHQLMHFGYHKSIDVAPENTTTGDQQLMDFSAQIEKQSIEIDRFISLQNERLRLALQEQNALFIKKLEPKTRLLLDQREAEIAKAAKRTVELQDFLNRMETENQLWQKVAKEKEAAVASLSSKIERLKQVTNQPSNAAEDAESCSQNVEEKMVCKCCNSRSSSVIILPCRHLCSCRDCEAFLDTCPVCRTVKKASIQALF